MNDKERIAELEAENERLKSRLEYREDGIDGIFCRDKTIEVADQQLATAKEENKRLEAELVSYKLERTMRQMAEAANSEYLKQLAAAQLRVKEFRDVVWLSHEHLKLQQGYTPGHNVFEANDKALATTDNDEALRRYVAKEMRKIGKAGVLFCKDWPEILDYADRYEKGEVK